MTNFELAQALVRLGAVTGDGARQRRVDDDGVRRNAPQPAVRARARRSRPHSMFQYTGVFVQPAVAVVSPDGDGVGDKQSLRYKLVRPSTVDREAARGPTAPSATRQR